MPHPTAHEDWTRVAFARLRGMAPIPALAVLRAVNDYFHALGALAFAGVLALWLGLLPDDTTLAGWWAAMAPLAFLGPVVHALMRASMRSRGEA